MNIQINTIYSSASCGDFTVLKYKGWDDVTVRFVDTGYETTTRADKVKIGCIRDPLFPSVYGIGFIGKGKYNSNGGGINKKAYKAWSGMIARCYDRKVQDKYPTYKDCVVCDEWHSYQVFAEWYENNYPKDGFNYDLDKDIKFKGNKMYCPVTCLLVTRSDNAKQAMGVLGKKWIIKDKTGLIYIVESQMEFCRIHDLNNSHFSSVLSGKRGTCKGFSLVSKSLLENLIKNYEE